MGSKPVLNFSKNLSVLIPSLVPYDDNSFFRLMIWMTIEHDVTIVKINLFMVMKVLFRGILRVSKMIVCLVLVAAHKTQRASLA